MKRRALLSTAAALTAGLGGCFGSPADSPGASDDATTRQQTPSVSPTERPSTSAESTRTTAPETTETTASDAVESVAVQSVQPSLVMLDTDVYWVSDDPERQYLYLRVDADSGAVAWDEFTLRFDGASYDPTDIYDGYKLARTYHDDPPAYPESGGSGWLLFEVPDAADGDATPTLSWPGGQWQPPKRATEALVAPTPDFDVSVTAPETVEEGDSPEIEVSVTNAGAVPGGFVGAANRRGPDVAVTPAGMFEYLLAPGETRTWRKTSSAETLGSADAGGDSGPDMTFSVAWHSGSVSKEIDVVEPESS